VIGNYDYRSPIGSVLDEAIFKGMATPSHYPAIKLELIKARTTTIKIPKPVEKPKAEKVNMSPTYYKHEDSWLKTQTNKR
jgi:hypothetical protein